LIKNVENWYFEKKFIVPNKSLEKLKLLLGHYFVRDPNYGLGTNNTIYYDTQDLSDYSDGLNGSANRKKVRVRFYNDTKKLTQANIEVKYKFGSMTGKVRSKIQLGNISTRQLYKLNLIELYSNNSQKLLRDVKLECYSPKIKIQYLRCRYFCPNSGLRINLDSQIKATDYFPSGADPLSINSSVLGTLLEIKGTKNAFLPSSIDKLELKGIAFSKYCYFLSSVLSRTKMFPTVDSSSDALRLNGWHNFLSGKNM
jgi:hypothetical protein